MVGADSFYTLLPSLKLHSAPSQCWVIWTQGLVYLELRVQRFREAPYGTRRQLHLSPCVGTQINVHVLIAYEMVVTEGTGPLLPLPLVKTKRLVSPTPQPKIHLTSFVQPWKSTGVSCRPGQPPLPPTDCAMPPLPAGQCATERLQPGAVPDPVREELRNHDAEE